MTDQTETTPDYVEYEYGQPMFVCGAKNRAGTPCQNRALFGNGRCKFHGGKSTGPKTAEGKKRSSQNAQKKRTPYDIS